jgi:endo-1,4-beta-xylanase
MRTIHPFPRSWLAGLILLVSCGGSDPVSPPPAPPPPPPPPPPAPVATVGISPGNTDLVPAQTQQFTATPRDAAGAAITGKTITWSSSGPAATVAAGLVTGVAAGSATITATSDGVSASVVVTIFDGGYIPASGGSFSAAGGDARLTVPVGALASPVAFRVAPATGTPADARVVAGTAFSLGPASTVFNSPATLQLRFPAGLPADVVVTQLVLGRLVNNAWTPLSVGPVGSLASFVAGPGSVSAVVDVANRLVSASITQSGTYAVMLPPPSLRGYAQQRGFRIGAAVIPSRMQGSDPQYAGTLAAHFNSVVAENVMKFGPIHPDPATYAFSQADAMMAFALQQGTAVHGHVLLWHSQLPGWVTNGTWTRATLLAALKSHVETVVGRYSGRIESWDVANEVVADPGDAQATPDGLRNTIFIQVIGPDVIDSVFAWARRADPAAKLYLNDYGIESLAQNSVKMNRLLALAQRLRTAGIPIDGIGLQGHLTLQAPSRTNLAQGLAHFTSAGFDVRVSELDVRIPDGGPASDLVTQAGIYRDYAAACLANPRCTGITTWGFTDLHSWIPQFFPGFGRALPLDAGYQIKDAYTALLEELRGTP